MRGYGAVALGARSVYDRSPMSRPQRTLWLARAAIATMVACGDRGGDDEEGAGSCPPAPLLVAASDYSSSAVGLAVEGDARPLVVGVDLGRDPQLATSQGRAFLLARDQDLVFEIDARCGPPTRRIDLRDGSPTLKNPQDAAVSPSGEIFMPLFGEPALVVWREGAALARVDLTAYDDDGNPQASAIAIVGDGSAARAFVALERLDDAAGLRSTRPSSMLVVDVATRAVEQVVALEGRNPFGRMSVAGDALFLAEPGSFDSIADELAGIERFDARARTTALLVRERDLGGSAAQVVADGECGAAIVADAEPNVNRTSLVTFSVRTGRVVSAPALGPTDGYDLQGLALAQGRLYVGDRRRGAAGYPIHSFRVGADCSVAAEPTRIFVAQKPVALAPTTTGR